MTEQEKQAIRERLSLSKHMNGLANHIPHPVYGTPWNPFQQDKDDIERLLEALDERDREVESLRKQVTKRQSELCDMDSKVAVLEEEKEINAELSAEWKLRHDAKEEENQRLRKALEELSTVTSFNNPYNELERRRKVARKALAGEEKK